MEDKEDKEELMNKEELMTLLTPQGTSHCSCLEHCFLLCAPEQGACRNQFKTRFVFWGRGGLSLPHQLFSLICLFKCICAQPFLHPRMAGQNFQKYDPIFARVRQLERLSVRTCASEKPQFEIVLPEKMSGKSRDIVNFLKR